jgi:CRISPR-associated protein Cmr6
MSYPIPKQTVLALAAHHERAPQNPGLLFDRLSPMAETPVPGRRDTAHATAKKDALQAVRAAAKADVALLQAWNARWGAAVRAAFAEPLTLETDWRFIPGLGRKGPLEVGFSFNRYGFPILPGSSVKGIARAYAELVADKDENNPDFLAIFGRAPEKNDDADGQSGGAVFFDAVPAQLPALDLDIMNPHYPDYYQDPQKSPGNWQSPVPVYFLVVAAGMKFHFAVGWRRQPDENAQRLQKLATDWLIGGLADLGAGAKTTAGYGYFGGANLPDSTPSAAGAVKQGASIAAPTAPRLKSQGRVRYKERRVFISDDQDPNIRASVDWKALGMESLKDKTPVEYEYEELPDKRRKAVKVTRLPNR